MQQCATVNPRPRPDPKTKVHLHQTPDFCGHWVHQIYRKNQELRLLLCSDSGTNRRNAANFINVPMNFTNK